MKKLFCCYITHYLIFFGKDQGYKILRVLTIDANCSVEGLTTYKGKYSPIAIKLNSSVLNANKNASYFNWLNGTFTTSHPYSVIVHEFGHLVDIYHLKFFEERMNVDNCSGFDNEFSNFAFVYKSKICSFINSEFNFYRWQLINWFNKMYWQQDDQKTFLDFLKVQQDPKKSDYCIIQTFALMQCILNN